MMHRMSISIDEKTVAQIQAELRKGFFRNKSHFIEYAVRSYIKATTSRGDNNEH